MKKNRKIFIFLMVMGICTFFGKNVNAYSISNGAAIEGTTPHIKRYTTTVEDGAYMTYCLDPGRAFGGSTSNYSVKRVIDPSKSVTGSNDYKFDLAATYIYRIMLQEGYADTSDSGRIVGTTAFRLAARAFSDGGMHGKTGGELDKAFHAYDNMGAGITKNQYESVGIRIAADAINFANQYGNTPYSDLQNDSNFTNIVWNPTFEAVDYQQLSNTGTEMEIRFTIKPTNDISTPEKFQEYYQNFSAGCENQTVQCTVSHSEPTVGPGGVNMNMTINISNWDKQDLGIYVDAPYCDPKAASYQLVLLGTSSQSVTQRMIVVSPGTCPANAANNSRLPRSRTRVIPSQNCVCNYDSNGEWDGTYTWNKYENGILVDSKPIEYGPELSQYPECPPAETCKKQSGDDCECQLDSNGVWTGKYILTSYTTVNGVRVPGTAMLLPPDDPRVTENKNCKPKEECDGGGGDGGGDKNGKTCACEFDVNNKWTGKYIIKNYLNGVLIGTHPVEENSQEAKDNNCKPCGERTHICETPEKSGDGKYYGPDGEELGTGEDGRKQYIDKCTNTCKPTVSIPSTCTDFNESGDHLTASINDINKTSTSCNSTVNPVKDCVLGGEDATGATYEDKINNKYCKVWCEESYDFNLPTARLSTSGEYFTLNMSIRGNRNCYTSSATDPTKPIGINKDGSNQFLIDLEEARKEVITKYNEYAKWAAAAGKKASKESISNAGKTCSSDDGSDDGSSSGGPGASYGSSGGPGTISNKTNSKKNINAIFLNEDGCKECAAGESSTTYYKKEWEWTKYNYDGTTSKQNETYESGSCGDCSCTPGDDPDSLDKKCDEKSEEEKTNCKDVSHPENAKKAKEALEMAIKKFYQIITSYNSCSGNITSRNTLNLGDEYYSSNGWMNDMQFDPEITFEYHENYLEKKAGNFVAKEGTREESHTYEFCTGDINDSYECTSKYFTKSNNNSIPENSVVKTDLILCDTNGCRKTSVIYSSAQWVKKSVTIAENYGPKNTFSTLTPYGTIKLDQGRQEFYTALPEDALPVKLITKTGAYPFTYTFNKIGQSNETNELGRLIGNSKSVLTAFNELKTEDKCSGTDKVAAENVTNKATGGYLCHYIVNCPDCTGRCDPDKETCELCLPGDPDCDDPCTTNCKAFCKNCVYDGGEATYSFKPVSLNTLYPNGISSEYRAWNWSNEYKGQITQKQIESDGESIYTQAQFSVDLTISDLKNIREYNDDANSFVNAKLPNGMSNTHGEENAIYCDKITVNGKEYNVRCRSTFLDYMEEHKGVYGTITERVTRDDDGFELFIDDSVQSITGCGSRNNYSCLNKIGIGPSWRVKKVGGNE